MTIKALVSVRHAEQTVLQSKLQVGLWPVLNYNKPTRSNGRVKEEKMRPVISKRLAKKIRWRYEVEWYRDQVRIEMLQKLNWWLI